MSSVLAASIVVASAMGSVWLASDRTANSVADDPISGEWEGTVSGDAFPEDLLLSVSLEMDEEFAVTGTFSTLQGDAPFEGDYDVEKKTLTGVVDAGESGTWDMSLKLDEDELNGDATEENSGATATVTLERSEDD